MYTPGTSSSRRGEHRPRRELVELVERAVERGEVRSGGKRAPPLVKDAPPGLRFQRKDTEQYHVCLGAPGISRSDRRRFAASLLDAILGRLGVVAPLPGDREKRGMAYAGLLVHVAVHRHGPDRRLRRHARGQPRRRARDHGRADRRHRGGNLPERELQRAKENLKGRILLSMESTSTRMNRLGKSLVTDSRSCRSTGSSPRSTRSSRVGERARGRRCSARAALRAGIGPSEERFLEALERVTPTLARAA
jgi:hypothetical protein